MDRTNAGLYSFEPIGVAGGQPKRYEPHRYLEETQ
jgi:hypothetical protein